MVMLGLREQDAWFCTGIQHAEAVQLLLENQILCLVLFSTLLMLCGALRAA